MTCSTVAEQIHLYVDGELAGPARAEVEGHLAGCAACREGLSALQGLGQLLRRELAEAAGQAPSVWPAVAARLDGAPGAHARGRVLAFPGQGARPRSRVSWRTLVPVAAAAAVVAAVGLDRWREAVAPAEAPAQVASVEGGDGASVVLLAGTPSEPPIILVTEAPAAPRPPEGGSSL